MKVLIVGLGSIGKKHLKALFSFDPAVKIYALRSNINSSNKEGVISIFDRSDIPNDIDFSMITNPTHEHFKTLKWLIPIGKPIFIEKPPLKDKYEIFQIKELLKKFPVITYVAFNLRFLKSLIWLKENIDISKVKEVHVNCGSYLPNWRPGMDYRDSYSAKAELGGGVHLDLIHEIDYVKWIFGNPTSVFCQKNKVSSLDINSFDFGLFHLKYSDKNIIITLNYFRPKPNRKIEIVSEDGIIYVDLISNEITNDEGEIIFSSNEKIEDSYRDQIEYFVSHLKTEKDFPNNLRNSFETLELALK